MDNLNYTKKKFLVGLIMILLPIIFHRKQNQKNPFDLRSKKLH